ncbi:MAG: response regulator [Acidobacteria bacterium]|nr:response regulator [Acidobacteriota bacterium]
MDNPKRLRVLALRGDAPGDEDLFRRLQDQVLLTSAWTIEELEVLLKGGSYDLFLCTRLFGGRDCRAAFRLVRQNAPLLPAVSYCTEGRHANKLHIMQAGAAGIVPQNFFASPVLSMLEKLALRGGIESAEVTRTQSRAS